MKIYFFVLVVFGTVNSFSLVKPWSSSLPESSVFTPSEEISERVDFWIKIYSYYNTNQGVFHLVDDPGFVLGEIDLGSIYENSVLSGGEKKKRAEKYLAEKRAELLKKWKIADGRKIRLQMGLKDRMEKAFFISGRYLPMMESIFRKNHLPIELTRLVFVESSFNVLAQSKVGASGLWQIMPSVARPHGFIKPHYDKRNHPMYSTTLAAQILKQNYRSLSSWPLAITAYNHGVTGVKRMVLKNETDSIEELIEAQQVTPSWGFASKNFYACFLAVLEVERNAGLLFGKKLVQSKELNFKEFRPARTISKSKILRLYNGSLSRFKQMNPHLNWARLSRQKRIPAGIPLVVPSENFHMVSQN